MLPAVKRKVFTTTADNQNFLEFCVVKETAPFASEYLMVRKFRVYGIRPKKREVPRIEVTFYIDEQKHLEVKAMDLETNRRLYIQDLFRRDRLKIQESMQAVHCPWRQAVEWLHLLSEKEKCCLPLKSRFFPLQ